MRFIIEVIDDHIKRLEEQDDVVFRNRLNTIIVKELQGYNDKIYRGSVRVIEIPENEKIQVGSGLNTRTY